MIDLNHILIFIAVLSPLVMLVRALRMRGRARGWVVSAAIVLSVSVLCWWFVPHIAGYLGGGAWLLLLLLPSLGMRRVQEWTLEQRLRPARRLAGFLRWLHPADGWVEQPHLLRAMELAAEGDQASALEILGQYRSLETSMGRQAIAQSFRIARDWAGLVEWCRREISPAALRQDAGLMPLYLRALGETGDLAALIAEFAAWEISAPLPAGSVNLTSLALLPVLAFCGRPFEVAELTQTELAKLPATTRQFWFYTAALYSHQPELGRAGLRQLRSDPAATSIGAEIDDRLDRAAAAAPMLAPDSARTLDRLLVARRIADPGRRATRGRASRMVWALIAVNAAVFALEIALGGTTDYEVLHRLGALEPELVLANGEWWRLLSALFLHFGSLHLLFNLYALYVLGPPLERSIGAVRFLVCYFGAGLGSSGGVVLLRYLGWINADLLVGASGAVMGVVGAWAGLHLRHRHAPFSRGRLQNVAVIVVLQTLFDLATPQVSMAAHLCGLFTGFILGFALAPARLRA